MGCRGQDIQGLPVPAGCVICDYKGDCYGGTRRAEEKGTYWFRTSGGGSLEGLRLTVAEKDALVAAGRIMEVGISPYGERRTRHGVSTQGWTQDGLRQFSDGSSEIVVGYYGGWDAAPGRDICTYCGADNTGARQGFDCYWCGGN